MKLIKFLIIFLIFSFKFSYAYDPNDFNNWKLDFKKIALKNNISENTFNLVMSNVQYLPKVIEYDRFQPEFYEDTKTYIEKRTSKQKQIKGINFYNNNKNIIEIVEDEFNIEKELLLALMGIETNFGTYVGKMDILSSLATLSYDKRRSEFLLMS
jgi:membrane-bound lytic murein transglycosylase B